MIIVIGDVSLREVHHHVDDARRLVFVERWADRAAPDAHFAVPESVAFAHELTALAIGHPLVEVHEVTARSSGDSDVGLRQA